MNRPDTHAADALDDRPEFSLRDLYRVLLTHAGYLEQQVRFTVVGDGRRAFSKAELRRELARFDGMRNIVLAVVRDKYPGAGIPEHVRRQWDSIVSEGERRSR
ncbi:hypothetical protein PP533_14165 [Mycobacteroides abscessus]|uniref:hypothetical protein n=1 Tax=Mycobacteroides abscessus TaxID=36809 RepID=UPI0012FFDBBB|nr:hypothetical protein [Mycobacteroides abscessus]MDM2349095.1 hypothetical protein [Mycobacteroides abscessus]MDM2359889.1 hypothetical protein [Mycobacteroides abscessus]